MVESSELLEKFEWMKEKDSFVHVDTHRQEVQDEAADVLMVLLLFCNAAKIDITSAVMHKLQEIKVKIQSHIDHKLKISWIRTNHILFMRMKNIL